MQVLHIFSRQNLQTFDISHAFLPLTIAKLSTFKNGPFFGPPCTVTCRTRTGSLCITSQLLWPVTTVLWQLPQWSPPHTLKNRDTYVVQGLVVSGLCGYSQVFSGCSCFDYYVIVRIVMWCGLHCQLMMAHWSINGVTHCLSLWILMILLLQLEHSQPQVNMSLVDFEIIINGLSLPSLFFSRSVMTYFLVQFPVNSLSFLCLKYPVW